MLQRHNLQTAYTTILCLFVVVSTQWSCVVSASVTSLITDGPLLEDTAIIQEEQHEYNKNKINNDLLYSDEIPSAEYDDGDFLMDFNITKQEPDHEWDVLIFSQQWPVTTCYHWREEDETHKCVLPAKKEFWTIHGIWPTKFGHLGPSFCNKSAEFNLDILQQIKERLKLYWLDIDGQTQDDWLWKHEWLKHGTCAAVLAALNDELKYFGQGLQWRNIFLLSNILGYSNIHPDSNNTVVALQTALIKVLGKNPSIHCWYDNKKDISYLAEIRLCFDKQLQLTDCDGVKRGDAGPVNYPGGTVITNCHISKPVHYPSIVPPVLRKKAEKWKFPVVNAYKMLQFIMWFTF